MIKSVATSRVATIAAASAGVIATFAFALSANAQTVTDLQAQVQALLAQIASLQGSTVTTAASCNFTQNLTVGSRGAEVLAAQKFLNTHGAVIASTGAGSPGNETTYFGGLTRAAVARYQAANGISPAAGYWGPVTRTFVNGKCTVVVNPGTGTGTGTTVSGPVSVALASVQPSTSIVAGQAAANLANLTFIGNGTVTQLRLQRTGISTDSTLNNVYLYDGNIRVSDSASVINGVITFNAPAGLFTVNGSRNLSVRADVSNASTVNGNTVGVNVTGLTTAGGTMATVANVVGPIFTVASVSGAATVNFSGTSAQPANSTVSAGVVGYSIWNDSFTVGNRAVNLKAVTFKYIGSAPTNALANVKLYIDGVDTGATAVWSNTNGNNRIGFDLSSMPKVINTGTHTLDLRADIVAGAYRDFTVSIENAGDFMVEDSQIAGYNVGATYNNTSNMLNNFSAGTVTIQAGSLTITQNSDFASVTQVVGGSTNANIASYKIQSYGEDVKINTLTITPYLNGTSTADGLRNVVLYANGAPVGSAVGTWTGGSLTYNLGSSLIVAAGSSTILEVHADIMNSSNTALSSGNVRVDLAAGSSNFQGMTSSKTGSTPSASGQTLTIVGSNVNFGVTSGFTNQTVSPNTSRVKIGSYTIQAGNAEDVTVTNIRVDLSGVLLASSSISNLTVSDAATPIGIPTASNNFSVNYVVPKNTSHTVDVWADLGSVTGTVNTAMVVTYRGNTSGTTGYTNGNAVVNGPTVSTAAGVLTNVSLDNSSPASQYVVGGTNGVGIANFNFRASTSSITITQLTLVATSTNGISSVTVGGVTQSVVNTGASTSTVTISGLNLQVPLTSAGILVPVTVNLAPVTSQSGNSNTLIGVRITGVQYLSGNSSVASTTNAASNALTLVGTKPVVTVANGGGAGLLISGAQTKLGEVTVSADPAGDMQVNTIAFTVNTAGFTGTTTLGSFILADGVNGSSNINNNSCSVSGSVVTCTISGGYTLAKGTSKTFSLLGGITGTAQTSTKASVSTSVLPASSFTWTDLQGGVAGLTGSLIYNYPSNSWTVSQ